LNVLGSKQAEPGGAPSPTNPSPWVKSPGRATSAEMTPAPSAVLLGVLFVGNDAYFVPVARGVLECLAPRKKLGTAAAASPEDLVTRRTKRDETREQIIAARARHESLVADLRHAEGAVRQAARKVANAAVDVARFSRQRRSRAVLSSPNMIRRQNHR
jgi:hypothetical protein